MDLANDYRPAAQGTASQADLIVGPDGDLATVDGPAEVGQLMLLRMRWLAGEWFLDTSQGVPWFTSILGQRGLSADAESILQNAALTTPGVLQLLAWQASLDPQTRTLSVQFRAQAAQGIIDYNGTLAAVTS